MVSKSEKFDYEKRITDYRASTDQKALDSMSDPNDFARIAFALHNFDAVARLSDNPSYRTRDNVAAAQLEFRTRIDGTSVISTVVPDTSRKWILITSARIEKRKADEHL